MLLTSGPDNLLSKPRLSEIYIVDSEKHKTGERSVSTWNALKTSFVRKRCSLCRYNGNDCF